MSDTQNTRLLPDKMEKEKHNKNVQDSKDKLWKQIIIMIAVSLLFSFALFGLFYIMIK